MAYQIPGVKLLRVCIQARFSEKRAPQLTEFRKGIIGISRAWKEGEQLVLQEVQTRKAWLLMDMCSVSCTLPQNKPPKINQNNKHKAQPQHLKQTLPYHLYHPLPARPRTSCGEPEGRRMLFCRQSGLAGRHALTDKKAAAKRNV